MDIQSCAALERLHLLLAAADRRSVHPRLSFVDIDGRGVTTTGPRMSVSNTRIGVDTRVRSSLTFPYSRLRPSPMDESSSFDACGCCVHLPSDEPLFKTTGVAGQFE
jgi:hypothetical protein